MGVIVNPRGTAGAGKTTVVRTILAAYGNAPGVEIRPLHRPGRKWPMGYRLDRDRGHRPLLVLGHYERSCGGCDTIPLSDGGMEAVFEMAAEHAADGHDVLLEGLALSAEHRRTAALARKHRVHVLRLATPASLCVRNLLTRRRAGASLRAAMAAKVDAENGPIVAACARLEPVATVESVTIDEAIQRSCTLLGVTPPH